MASGAKQKGMPAGVGDGLDPEEMAKTELAKAMIPTPDDIMDELSPLAALYLLDQMAWATFTNWTAWLSDMTDEQKADAESAAPTLSGLGLVCGELDAICAAIGLAPQG